MPIGSPNAWVKEIREVAGTVKSRLDATARPKPAQVIDGKPTALRINARRNGFALPY